MQERLRWKTGARRAASLAAVMVIGACHGSATLEANLEGTVIDAFGVPIEGATVVVTSALVEDGKRTAVTDGSGRYRFAFEGIGSFALIINAEGYAQARSTGTITDVPDVFGDFKANAVRDITLYKLSATLKGQVTRTIGNQPPLTDVRLRVRINEGSVSDASIVTAAKTDTSGKYEFTKLPSGVTVTLFIPAFDVDGDGDPDTAATSSNVFLNFDTTVVVNRSVGQFAGPSIIWSNVNNTLVEPDAELKVVYNVPMEKGPERRRVSLRQISPQSFEVFRSVSFSSDALELTVKPERPLTRGARYNLGVTTYTAADQQQLGRSYNFNVRGEEGPGSVANLQRDDDGAKIRYNQVAFAVRWDSVDGASGYRVYARKSEGNITDWVLAASYNTSATPLVRATVTAPAALRPNGRLFDTGAKLLVAVSAIRDGIEGALSKPLTLGDEDCPRITSASETGSWNNSAGTSDSDVRLTVGFSEPMSPTIKPKLEMPASASSGANLTFSLTSQTQGVFSGTIAAGTNAAGTVTIDMTGIKDPSGNLVCEGQQKRIVPVL